MTPQEKANELVDRYLEYVEAYSSQGQIENAKTCALIAVNEILKLDSVNMFWVDVKRYIKAIA
jgi:predicted Ser/Thr protein kinase